MAKIREFYKGRRKRRNYAIIPFAVLLGVIALIMVSFYGLQRYAVITSEGVSIRFPLFEDGEDTVLDSQGNEMRVFEQVEPQLIFDEPDYTRVKATAGRYLSGIKAIFVPYTDLNTDKIGEYTQRLRRGNALVLEMKPRNGLLMWNSRADAARSYGLALESSQADAVEKLIMELKDPPDGKDIYLAAQISCCIDELFPSRSTSVALRTGFGTNYTDANGTWLDPYNADVRHYAAQLAQELFDMGFDEVILADVQHPVPEVKEGQDPVSFVYSRDMSTTPNPVNAVCGFAVSVAQELEGHPGALSIYVNKAEALVKADPQNGQDAVLFMKLFDRVYYPTDTYTYTNFNVGDIEDSVTIGDVHVRFVPVLTNYLFSDSNDNASWVLVDKVEEPEPEG